MKQSLRILLAAASIGAAALAQAEVAVIVNAGASAAPSQADVANIFLGKITKWNDPAIAALNPNVKLPDATIAPVRRADGSGTSFNFTNYLSKVSPEWKEKIGEGKAVNWPVGTGGKGSGCGGSHQCDFQHLFHGLSCK